jgi:beta-mannosidase
MTRKSLDLTGEWQFKEFPILARRMRELESTGWHDCNVPGSIFNSLIQARLIDEAELYASPEKFTYISEKPWVYKKIFDVPEEILQADRIELVFDGLDTLTNIWLNEKLIAKTSNMFIPHRFDVTKLLKAKANSLVVKFEPAEEYAKNLMDRYTKFAETDFINPHRVYIRKAQYQFGWDFCPSLAGCGIWQPVSLEAFNKAKIDDIHIATVDCNKEYADIKIAIKLDTILNEDFSCKLNIYDDKQKIEQILEFRAGEDFHSTVIRVDNLKLWSPAGYGEPNLYKINTELLCGGQTIDSHRTSFGIRIVKLNRSEKERKFQFEINGQPVYVRGANWVPPTLFAGSVTESDYENLLTAAADANINMLRVWGGGYYETERFYRLCDKLGIMVWQDFMFACGYYPDRGWFTKDIEAEAASIIKRLRNHPCLTIWCGNNEIDRMHYKNEMGKGKKFYGKAIFHKLLPCLVSELDPAIPYISTTPLGNKDSFKNDRTLTTHQWDIWSGHKPVREYRCSPEDTPAFVTEFGLQSMPSFETIEKLCAPQTPRLGSFRVEKQNYQIDGNSQLYRYVADLFGPVENTEKFTYYSQITQARAAKTYVEHLRASNRNAGVLFWQFNDCWPAITWSAIDFYKEPKALYYYAKRFFAKVLVTAINDTDQPITATLKCTLTDLHGNIIDDITFPLTVAPFGTSVTMRLPRIFTHPENPEKTALHLLMEKEGVKIAENLLLYLPDKFIDWPRITIEKHLTKITDSLWKIKLKSNAIAKDVQIKSAPDVRYSDNFIDLLADSEYEININSHLKNFQPQSTLQLRAVNAILQ